MLLLHGAISTAAEFDSILSAFPEPGGLHAFDFPGHGAMAGDDGPFGIEAFAAATIAEMDRIGRQSAELFGFSMGGYVALYLAATLPERVERVVTLGTKMDWTPEGAAREVKMLDPDTIDAKVPAFGATLRARHGDPGWRNNLAATASMMTGLGNAPLLTDELLATIRCPVRITVGDRDRMVSIEESIAAYRAIPESELVVLPSTTHGIEQVAPAEWAGRVCSR